MEFIDKAIQQYAEAHTKKESTVLNQLNRYTHTSVLKPRMLSGHLQGRFISMMSCLMKPKYVLDIGTYTGYSALCLAEGLTSDGIVHTIDINEEVMSTAEKFFSESPFHNQIKPHVGDALSIIEQINKTIEHWDIIWMDAEKSEYPAYYEAVIEKLRPGGLIMADNVLWSGKVVNASELAKDQDTAILDAFNKQLLEDSRVENLLLPVRDGIMMARKL
jgi:predicted O-methyltransferase YrrM